MSPDQSHTLRYPCPDCGGSEGVVHVYTASDGRQQPWAQCARCQRTPPRKLYIVSKAELGIACSAADLLRATATAMESGRSSRPLLKAVFHFADATDTWDPDPAKPGDFIRKQVPTW